MIFLTKIHLHIIFKIEESCSKNTKRAFYLKIDVKKIINIEINDKIDEFFQR